MARRKRDSSARGTHRESRDRSVIDKSGYVARRVTI